MPVKSILYLLSFVLFVNQAVQAQLTYAQLKVEYDSIWTYKNLQLVPVRFRDEPKSAIPAQKPGTANIGLADALNKGKAKIKEVLYANGADLNWLEVQNLSKQSLVINSGDLLSGGKQDRMIGETKIIAPGKSDYLKVYCVEKGRWDKKIKSFKHRGAANTDIKKIMDISGRQHDVWKEIERQFASENKTSATWPFLQLYENRSVADSDYIRFFMGKFKESDSAYAGFLAITDNKIINCELFASTELTNLAFPSLLSSLVQTAVKGKKPVMSIKRMETFMDKFLESEAAQKIYLATHGQIHLQDGRVIHLIAYDD